MIYRLYDFLLCLSALFLVPYYLLRGLRYGKMRRGIRERVGIYTDAFRAAVKGRNVIWVHAVSVGETRAAVPLLKALKQQYPDSLLLISNVTETGRAIADGIKEADACVFFPFDLSWVVRKVLTLIRPSIIILVETEIWPNFVMQAQRLDIPVVLVNGRISDRSFPRYRKAAKILAPILGSVSAFCMQTEQDARRIRHLGARTGRVQVTGNLKFDMRPPQIDSSDLGGHRQSFCLPDDARIWVAGSTHEGEETLLIKVYQRLLATFPNLFLVLVPRHPERCRQVVDEVGKKNLAATLRSSLVKRQQALSAGEVLVVDTLGEMLKLYALADLVFVGGSIVPVGGHNVLEASLMKKPVMFGMYMQNFKEIARLLRQAHGGLQVRDEEDLYLQMKLLLENPEEALRIGDNGSRLLQENRGATERTLEVIARQIA